MVAIIVHWMQTMQIIALSVQTLSGAMLADTHFTVMPLVRSVQPVTSRLGTARARGAEGGLGVQVGCGIAGSVTKNSCEIPTSLL